jgi:hypothetical protein
MSHHPLFSPRAALILALTLGPASWASVGLCRNTATATLSGMQTSDVPRPRVHAYVYGRANFVAGGSPIAVVSGDLDQDGALDLIAVNNSSDTVSVLIGGPGGSFSTHVDYPTGIEPNATALADLDSDGDLDLAVVDQNCPAGTCGTGSVSVLLGHGDGTFALAVDYATNTNPQSVAIGDWNGDSRADLAVVNAVTIISQGPGTVSILLGNGDGTFQPASEYRAGEGPGGIVTGDFDGDGSLDLAITNFIAVNVVSAVAVLLGKGDGSFEKPVSFPTANGPVSLVSSDLDLDGHLDLATADLGASMISVLRGNGDGTFQVHVDYPTGFAPKALTISDLDQDGLLDLALTAFTAVPGSGSVVLLPGNGDGTFQPYREYFTGPIGPSIMTGDFDGDSKPDLAAPEPSGHVTVLLGNGDGTLPAAAESDTGSGPVAITRDDFDRDQRVDLAIVNQLADTVSILLGVGDGSFLSPVDYATGDSPSAVIAGDFNGDGVSDLAVADALDDTLSVLLGRGDGSLRTRQAYATGSAPLSLVAGDFDGDGELDVASADSGADAVSVLLGKGDGRFWPHMYFVAGPGPISISSSDFDRDGALDLVLADANTPYTGPGKIALLFGNGDGTFGAPVLYDAGIQAVAVTTGDFNADSKPDVAVATDLDVFGSVTVLLGNGDGTLQPQVGYPTGRIAVSVGVADFNGDRKPDLAVVNQGSNLVTILAGRGDGTFGLQANYGTGFGPSALVSGFFDHDDELDLAVVDLFGDSLSVFVSK